MTESREVTEEDDDVDEVEISIDNLAQAIKHDFLEASATNKQLTFSIKDDVQNFIRRKSNSYSEDDEIPEPSSTQIDDQDDSICPSPASYVFKSAVNKHQKDDKNGSISQLSVPYVLKSALTKLHHKAALDMQVVKLCDEYTVKEKSRFIREQYIEKYITLIPEKVISDFENLNNITDGRVTCLKNDIDEFFEVDEAETSEKKLERTINEAFEDFEYVNSLIKSDVEIAKVNIRNYFNILIPPTTAPPTREELESEGFVKEHFIELISQIRDDVVQSKRITDKLVKRAKYEIDDILTRKISSTQFKRMETTLSKMSFVILHKPEEMIEHSQFYQDFIETNRDIKETFEDIIAETHAIRRKVSMKRCDIVEEADHILEDIIVAVESIKKSMSYKNIEIQDTVKQSHQFTKNFENKNVKKTVMQNVRDIQQGVKIVKQLLETQLKNLNNDLQTKNTESVKKNVGAKALDTLEKATLFSVNTFKETNEKMVNEIKIIKSIVAEKFEPIINILPPLSTFQFEIQSTDVSQTDVSQTNVSQTDVGQTNVSNTEIKE